jgi:hypothetical protein
MTPRQLTDDELRMLAVTHLGLTLRGAADLMERDMLMDVDTVMKAVAPFLRAGADHATVKAVLEMLPRSERADLDYNLKIFTILNTADYGLPN